MKFNYVTVAIHSMSQDIGILSKTLSSNSATKVIALDLSYNALTDASMDILSECIKVNDIVYFYY